MILVSRHKGMIAWVSRRMSVTKIIPHASVEDIEGQEVIGNLPLHLCAKCSSITTVSVDVPPELRGVELTEDQINNLNPRVETYLVLPVPFKKNKEIK